MVSLTGLITAMVTPFRGDELDEHGFINNIYLQLEHHVDGLVILGSTGEDATLTIQEKETLIKMARKTAPTLPLIVGTGSYSTKMTIENSLRAIDCGADYLLIVCPYYNKPTQEGLFRHYEAIAQHVSKPIILYNVISRTGINLEIPTIKRLAQFPNIIGIKECSTTFNALTQMIDNVKAVHKDFKVFTGDDINTFSSLLLGADGVISVVSNLLPHKMKELISALKAQDVNQARTLHYALFPLFQALFLETNPIPVKEAMNYVGFAAGNCRLPLTQMDPEKRIELLSVIEKLEISFPSLMRAC